MEYEELKIIGCAMTVYSALGPGFLESVYQNALAHEVRKAGLAECERKIQVTYDDKVVGDFSADMLVQNLILIENKAVQTLIPAPTKSLKSDCRSTSAPHAWSISARLAPTNPNRQDEHA